MLQGLYLITNNDPFIVLAEKLEIALKQGLAAVQYRRKLVPPTQHIVEAEQLLTLCQKYDTPLIINDNIYLAQQLHCGVHLGQTDGTIAQARSLLGSDAIIGRTCHNSLALAEQAIAEGATYLAMGAVYPSSSKADTATLDIGVLQRVILESPIPVCAIGGLTVENSPPVIALGVNLLAVISDVLDRPAMQIAARVHAWNNTFILCKPSS